MSLELRSEREGMVRSDSVVCASRGATARGPRIQFVRTARAAPWRSATPISVWIARPRDVVQEPIASVDAHTPPAWRGGRREAVRRAARMAADPRSHDMRTTRCATRACLGRRRPTPSDTSPLARNLRRRMLCPTTRASANTGGHSAGNPVAGCRLQSQSPTDAYTIAEWRDHVLMSPLVSHDPSLS